MTTPNQQSPEIARIIGVPGLYLKREDMHPLGSHKGRSIPVMIDEYMTQGFTKFSISSSGNAAITAGKYIQKVNLSKTEKISLEIYIGKNISPEKKNIISNLADEHIRISEKERPLQAFLQSIKFSDTKGLRQSTDNLALVGYESLAKELLEIPDLSAVFVATSSGTTAEALGEYFIKNKKNISIYIVQTSSCHPIAEIFNKNTPMEEKSIADAIVDKTAFRRVKVLDIIKKSGGSAFIVNNSEIKNAQEILAKNNASTSPNGALSLAGLIQSLSQDKKYSGSIACIIGGK